MKYPRWQLLFALSLIITSFLIYLFHYIIFKDIHHIMVFLVEDIAFLPIEVLLVTLIIHRVLSNLEKSSRLEKLNMVIGAFFVQVGTKLLAYLSDMDPELESIRSNLLVTSRWSDEDFSRIAGSLKGHEYIIDINRLDLRYLNALLSREREFFLRLIENPALMEHESFTDLLLAIFHLTEELARRPSLEGLPRSDMAHLAVDIGRTYRLLVLEWLDYMRYLKRSYPYLFHLAMRTNPFDQTASPVIRDEES
jgi:hypothetical protein